MMAFTTRMQVIRLVAILLILLPLVANAAEFFEWDWETYPSLNVNPVEGVRYQGNCFDKKLGDPFTSVEVMPKYKRTGTKSARLYTDSRYKNADGHRDCESIWKTEKYSTNPLIYKNRLEPRYGTNRGRGANGFESWNVGHERWFRHSFYLPSNEGNFAGWNTGPYSHKNIMIMQIMAANPSTTHEVAFLLGAGPTLKVEIIYALEATDGTEIPESLGTFPLKKDAWNDIVYVHRPHWQTPAQNPTGYGRLKIWLNCQDWSNCNPTLDYKGPSTIRHMADRYWKGGLYEMHFPEYNRQIAMYVDSYKMGIRQSETDEEMFALMADVYGANPPDEDHTPPPSIPINFIVQ